MLWINHTTDGAFAAAEVVLTSWQWLSASTTATYVPTVNAKNAANVFHNEPRKDVLIYYYFFLVYYSLYFTISLDYQQSKLTPHWGYSAQPSETY